MMLAVIGAVAIVGIAGYWLARLGRFVHAQWFVKRAWRWCSGQAHHGHPVTDAGWFRHGQRALTATGHATRWWHLPRWQRAGHRTGGTLGVVGLVAAFLVNPQVTTLAIVCLLFVSAAFSCWLAWRRLRARDARRSWLHPLHLAAHELAGIPRARRAESWITAEIDASGAVRGATLELPPGWPADGKDEGRLAAIAGAKLGIESPEATWRRAGPVPLLTLRHSPPPPGWVGMSDLVAEIMKCKPHELLIGVGRSGELVKVSLATDSPHIAISMGTGAGKSNLAGWLLLQILIKGGIGLTLDAKRRLSYPWILKDENRNLVQLPNVAYAYTVEQLHDGMAWLSGELDRRGDVAFAGMDTRGQVHANVGPPLFTLAEELNFAVPRLRAHWQENRTGDGPAKSPAFTGLGETAFAGRQVRMHLILIGQMLTAEVTGQRDSSVKANCGIKMLARYEQKGWRIMCGDIPMPPPPTTTGRVQVVTTGAPQEVQTPELDPVESREMVLAGNIAPLPSTIPRSLVTGIPDLPGSGPWPADVTGSGVPAVTAGPVLVTLKEAVDKGLVRPSTTLASLKMARFRDRAAFPAVRGRDGQADLFDADDLSAYDLARG
jgi:hypothetical protein